jgi:putative oxidoreductase
MIWSFHPETRQPKENYMKIATIIARSLLGLIFVVFGLNMFLHFIPMPPPPEGLARDFTTVLFASHYLYVVGALQVVGGFLLFTGRWTPLGLTLVGPVIVNIVCFHVLMAPAGLPMAIVVSTLALFLLWNYRKNFAGILAGTPAQLVSHSQQATARTVTAHS